MSFLTAAYTNDEMEFIYIKGQTKEGGSLRISNSLGNIDDAQMKVDDYVQNMMNLYDIFGETIEVDLGKCKYLGRGGIGSSEERWIFLSNETDYGIWLDASPNVQNEGDGYEEICIIENLE